MRAVCLFFLCLLVCVGANEIINSQPRTYVSGRNIFQNNTIWYKCDAEDFGVTFQYDLIQDATGEVSNVTVTCEDLKYVYSLTLLGYVPYDGELRVSEVCGTRNVLSPYSNTNISLTRYDGFDNLFSLASLRETTPSNYHLQRMGTGEFGPSPTGRRLQGFLGVLLGGAVAGVVGSVVSCSFGFGCNRGSPNAQGQITDLTRQLQDYREQQDQVLSETRRLFAASNLQTELIQETLETFNSDLNTLTDVSAQLVSANELTVEAIARQRNFSLAMYDATNAALTNLRGEIAQTVTYLDDNTATLAANLGSLTSELQELFTQQTLINSNVSTNINDMNEELLVFRVNTQIRIERISRVLRNLMGRLKAAFERRQHNALRVREIFLQIASSEASGFTPFLHEDEPGAEPSDLAALRYSILMSDIIIMFADEDGLSNVRGYEHHVQLKCDLQYVLDYSTEINDIFDLMGMVGPENCTQPSSSNVYESSNTSCVCWVEWTKKSCILTAPGATTAESEAFKSAFLLNETAFCSSSLTTEEELTFTQGLDFTAKLDELCLAGTHSSNTGQFHVVDNVLNIDILVDPLSALHAACDTSSDPSYLGSTQTGDPILPSTVGQYMEAAYSLTINHRIDPYMDLLDGVMPSYLTTETNWKLVDGYQAECQRTTFVSLGTTFLPVYSLEPVDVTQVINVTVNGTDSYLVRDVLPITSFAFVLPADRVLIGEPDALSVYDIPANEIRVGPIAATRENSVTYMAVPALNATHAAQISTMKAWVERNPGQVFRHDKAGNFPFIYEKSVDSVTGLCLNESFAGNSWCSVLEKYRVTRESTGSISLTPRSDGATIVEFTIPDGELVGRLLITECPSWTNLRASANMHTLILGNEGLDQLEVEVEETGDCPSTTTVRVSGRSTESHHIQKCLTGAGEVVVNIYRYDENRNLIACENATGINATVDRVAYFETFEGNADDRLVKFRSANATDRAFLALTQNVLSLREELASVLETVATLVYTNSLVVFDDLSLKMNVSMDLLANRSASIREVVAEWQQDDPDPLDLADIRALFDSEMGVLIASAVTSLNDTRATIDQLMQNRAYASDLLTFLNETKASILELQESLLNVTATMFDTDARILEALFTNDETLARLIDKVFEREDFLGRLFSGIENSVSLMGRLAGKVFSTTLGIGAQAMKVLFWFVVAAVVGLLVKEGVVFFKNKSGPPGFSPVPGMNTDNLVTHDELNNAMALLVSRVGELEHQLHSTRGMRR